MSDSPAARAWERAQARQLPAIFFLANGRAKVIFFQKKTHPLSKQAAAWVQRHNKRVNKQRRAR